MENAAEGIEIRPLASCAEFIRCEDLQKEVWGFPERDIVPLAELVSTQKAGGIVAGAFDRSGAMLGFVMGFWALDEAGSVFHYSRRLGVTRSERGRGLGRLLKLYQRHFVLARGYGLVRWTYDPLEGENASLNIGKLGAEASDYLVDFYGSDPAPPNLGVPTDRFFVRWQVDSGKVALLASAPRPGAEPAGWPGTLPCVLRSRPHASGSAAVEGLDLSADGPRVTAEIPPSIRMLKASDLAEAMRWRMAFREAAQSLFSRGFRVTDFSSGEVEGRRRSLYVFSKEACGTQAFPGDEGNGSD